MRRFCLISEVRCFLRIFHALFLNQYIHYCQLVIQSQRERLLIAKLLHGYSIIYFKSLRFVYLLTVKCSKSIAGKRNSDRFRPLKIQRLLSDGETNVIHNKLGKKMIFVSHFDEICCTLSNRNQLSINIFCATNQLRFFSHQYFSGSVCAIFATFLKN